MLLDIYITIAIVIGCVWIAVVSRRVRRAPYGEFKSADVSHSLRRKQEKKP